MAMKPLLKITRGFYTYLVTNLVLSFPARVCSLFEQHLRVSYPYSLSLDPRKYTNIYVKSYDHNISGCLSHLRF
jgi:hypothetical protein